MKKIISMYSGGQGRKDHSYGGCGFYRNITPAKYFEKKYDIKTTWNCFDGANVAYTPEELKCSDELKKFDYISFDELKARNLDKIGTINSLLSKLDKAQEYVWFDNDALVWHQPDKIHQIVQLFGGRNRYTALTGNKKYIIADCDDNYDKLPDNNLWMFYGGKKEYEGRNFNINIGLEWADAITVSTKTLQSYYKNINKKVYYCPNMAWPEYWNAKDMRANEEEVAIVYWGSFTHLNDLSEVKQVLLDVLKENPNVRLYLVGQNYFKDLSDHPQVVELPPTHEFKDWPTYLNTMRFDIGIAPLAKDSFNKYKSNIKYMEYAFYRIPGVFCGYPGLPYFDTVKHGETGYLAVNYKDWKTYLERLIKDVALRHILGGNAYDDVIENYSFNKLGHYWDEAYADIFNQTVDTRLAMLGLERGK